jgi:predicted nuclease with TOPRIM domain
LETRVREADSKHSNATSALLQRIEQLQIQNNELTRVRSFDDQLRQQLAEREKQIETLTREKDDLVQRLVEKTQDSALPTEQVVDAKNKLSVQLSELQTATQRLTIENAKLKERLVLETQPERITKLTTAIEILQREKEDLTAQVNHQVCCSITTTGIHACRLRGVSILQGKLIEQLNDQRSDVADAINTATAQAETIKTLRNEKSQLAQFLHAKTVELAQVISERNQLRNQSPGQANTQHLEMTIAELRAEIRLLKSSTIQHPTPVAANPEPVPSPQKPLTPTSAPSTPARTHTPPISVTPERRQSGEIQPPNPLGAATQLPPMQPPEMEDMRPSPTPVAHLPQPEPPKIVEYETPKKSGWAGSVWNTIWGTD